jgi:NTP pyrophosphatase (non-canonical NTP hydrolase)
MTNKTHEPDLDIIRVGVPNAAIYEQMAEECCELAHALMKRARKIRNENYTPKTMSEINDSIIEEFTDVILCADVLRMESDPKIYTQKLTRWIGRTYNQLMETENVE